MKKTILTKVLALALCAVLMIGLFAGCGKDKTNTPVANPVHDPTPVGVLTLSCEASFKITYDAGALVQKLEGNDDTAKSIIKQYTDNQQFGISCSALIEDLLQKCYANACLDSEFANIILMQSMGSQTPGTAFLEGVLKTAEERNPTSAPVILVTVDDLDENGYISADTAAKILQTTLGLDSLDKIQKIGEMEDSSYPFAAKVGGRENKYAVDAITGQVIGVQVEEPNYDNYYEQDQNPEIDEPIFEFIPEEEY